MKAEQSVADIKPPPSITAFKNVGSKMVVNAAATRNRVNVFAGTTAQQIIDLVKSRSLAPIKKKVDFVPEDEANEEVLEPLGGNESEYEDYEEDEVEKRHSIQFSGYLDDERVQQLKDALKPRNLQEEAKAEPSPQRETKVFSLRLPNETKAKLLEIFPPVIVKKFDKAPGPIKVETIPNYDVKLPGIGRVRKAYRESFSTIRDRIQMASTAPPKIQSDDDMEGNVRNPFYYPKDVPAFMAAQEAKRQEKRIADLKVPTTEKLHGVSLIQKVVTERVRPYIKENVIADTPAIYNKIIWEAERGLNITRLQKVARKIHANYISYRKLIFYQEYVIHARMEALKQMHDIESKEEMALKNYEFLSNFTSEALDTFLRDNEESANLAGKVSEDKMRKNVELTQEVRNLKMETSSLKTEILSLNESLRECKYYMKFLDAVARELMRRDEEEAYRAERRQQQIQEEVLDNMKEGMTRREAELAVESQQEEYAKKFKKTKPIMETESGDFIKQIAEEAKSQTERSPVDSKIHAILQKIATKEAEEEFNEEELFKELDLVGGTDKDDREELAGLVFTRPSQLLNIFVECEEQCLSLIQHAQFNEESLESVEKQIQETRKSSESRARELRNAIQEMEEQIRDTTSRISTLKLLIDMFTGGYYDVQGQEKMMKLLRFYVNKVYKTATGVNDAHLDSIMMLTSIERNFEDLVRDLESMPTEVVLKISRELEKERREAERMELQQERNKHNEVRALRNLERTKSITVKKGRSLAFRSRPPKLVVKLTQQEVDKKAEEEEWNYYFGE